MTKIKRTWLWATLVGVAGVVVPVAMMQLSFGSRTHFRVFAHAWNLRSPGDDKFSWVVTRDRVERHKVLSHSYKREEAERILGQEVYVVIWNASAPESTASVEQVCSLGPEGLQRLFLTVAAPDGPALLVDQREDRGHLTLSLWEKRNGRFGKTGERRLQEKWGASRSARHLVGKNENGIVVLQTLGFRDLATSASHPLFDQAFGKLSSPSNVWLTDDGRFVVHAPGSGMFQEVQVTAVDLQSGRLEERCFRDVSRTVAIVDAESVQGNLALLVQYYRDDQYEYVLADMAGRELRKMKVNREVSLSGVDACTWQPSMFRFVIPSPDYVEDLRQRPLDIEFVGEDGQGVKKRVVFPQELLR